VRSPLAREVASTSDTGFYDDNFAGSSSEIAARVRDAAFLGEDFGQFSWITADQHRRVQALLHVTSSSRVLEIASGSGGPGLFTVRSTGCTLVGIDLHETGVATANAAAKEAGLSGRATFLAHDARDPLPFDDVSFDAVICIDSINHIFDRGPVFREWHRVLKDGAAAWYTDPAVVTGPIRREEVLARSPSMGEFVFTPAGSDRQLLLAAGFGRVEEEDLTGEIAGVAERWHEARGTYATRLDQIEGVEQNATFQAFLSMVARLAATGRLARLGFLATKGP
jgi:SAM-dependent methyltransferase